MQIKAIIFDADGVLVESQFLSTRAVEHFNAPLEPYERFFRGPFQNCLVGKADLKQEVAKVIHEWGWPKSMEELYEYWFHADFNKVDERFGLVMAELKEKGILCALGTNNEKYRTHDLIHHKGLGKWFAKHLQFSSAHVGHKKPELEYFAKVTRLLGLTPEEISFWDDDEKNVQAARLHGWQANHYTDFALFSDWMKSL